MKKFTKVTLLLILISTSVIAQPENCLQFDGIDDYVYVGDVNDLGTSDFTIEAWIYPQSIYGVGQKIVNKGPSTVGIPPNAGYGLRIFDPQVGGDLDFHVGHSNGTVTHLTYTGLTTNTWYHVAGVRQGRSLYLYLDGTLVASTSTSVVYNVDNDLPLAIGAIHKNGITPVNEFMNGKIDEVRIWEEARSAFDISTHKDCAITSPQLNLLAVYNLDEGSGPSAADSSGNMNHGTLVNGPVWLSSPVALHCETTIGLEDAATPYEVNIYPNPFTSSFTVQCDVQDVSVKVFNTLGQEQDVSSFMLANGAKINAENWPSGLYTVHVQVGDRKEIFRLMKQ